MTLIPVNSAVEMILKHTKNFGVEDVHFMKARNRVLAEDILADRDFPPFNRVSMDGIAFRFDALNNGNVQFEIEGIQAAGAAQLKLLNNENCIEVMTGSVLPENTNCVLQYEKVSIENGVATIEEPTLKEWQNIHMQGFDKKTGDVLVKAGTMISAAEIGVLATVGKEFVKVKKQPKVVVVSTGDELVDVNESPLNYQIRKSNVFTLASQLEYVGIEAEIVHLADDKESLKQNIADFLERFDVLMFSGAVSKGKFDFIPEVLDILEVKKHFHKVSQRPGKPFWFGTKGTKTVFAFPGNPVSTFVCYLKYFKVWYQESMGYLTGNAMAILSEDVHFKPNLTYFLQVALENNNGKIYAKPIKGKGSGDLANLVAVDAFMELPAGRTDFSMGEQFPILKFRKE